MQTKVAPAQLSVCRPSREPGDAQGETRDERWEGECEEKDKGECCGEGVIKRESKLQPGFYEWEKRGQANG